jgi:hypothetical protein
MWWSALPNYERSADGFLCNISADRELLLILCFAEGLTPFTEIFSVSMMILLEVICSGFPGEPRARTVPVILQESHDQLATFA